MKKGFTLVELLIVVVLMAVISTSSIIAFDNIDNDTDATDRINMFKNIQRSASLYIDLNDDWLNQFMTNQEIFISLGELKNTNYVNFDLEDPVSHEEVPGCSPRCDDAGYDAGVLRSRRWRWLPFRYRS